MLPAYDPAAKGGRWALMLTRLLGTILMDKGWMTFREVEMVLEKLSKLQQQQQGHERTGETRT